MKKKNKQEIILLNEEDLLKPIEWSPEEILNPAELQELAKEKGLKQFDMTKEPLVLIFIGHVDSGKSTISGQMMFLSGKVSEIEI